MVWPLYQTRPIMPVTIQHLSRQDRCDEVFALYRKDSGTLGFMPRGAFEEGITKGTLLVATDDQDQILGYLLYRVGARLCIHRAPLRGSGCARRWDRKITCG